MQKKKFYAIFGVLVVALSSFVLVYAAIWTADDMAVYMQNVGRHKIYQTNYILYQKISPQLDTIESKIDSDSVKNDTSRITTTQTNLGDWTLPAGSTTGFYAIMRVMVTGGEAAQFTVTAESVDYLTAKLEVWVDVNDDNAANALALDLDCSASTPNYGTATFVGNSFVLRLNVPSAGSPVSLDKEINWAYMVVAPPGVEITEEIWLT